MSVQIDKQQFMTDGYLIIPVQTAE